MEFDAPWSGMFAFAVCQDPTVLVKTRRIALVTKATSARGVQNYHFAYAAS